MAQSYQEILETFDSRRAESESDMLAPAMKQRFDDLAWVVQAILEKLRDAEQASHQQQGSASAPVGTVTG